MLTLCSVNTPAESDFAIGNPVQFTYFLDVSYAFSFNSQLFPWLVAVASYRLTRERIRISEVRHIDDNDSNLVPELVCDILLTTVTINIVSIPEWKQ